MSTSKSFADSVRDWEELLAAWEAIPDVLAPDHPLKLQLEAIVDQAREVKNQQQIQIADKQATTQQVREVTRSGEETARRLRSLARGLVGPRDERLLAFSVAPLRDRRKRKGVPEAPPPVPPPPAPEAARPSPQDGSPPGEPSEPAASSEP